MILYWLCGLIFSLLLFCVLLFTGFPISRVFAPKPIRRQRLWLKIAASWTIASLSAAIVLLSLYLFNNPTQYASNYSESNFRAITVGMSEPQVLALLGNPLGKWNPSQSSAHHVNGQPDYIIFDYSKSESDGDYELRQIHFDDGKVAKVRSCRYYD